MKKLLWLIVLFAWPVAGSAEEMSFVTTLSAPVGVFSRVETANPTAVATAPTVNFCQTRSNAGTITLQGTDANKVAFSTPSLQLQNGTTLGGNVPFYQITNILSLQSGGKLTGGSLHAYQVQVLNTVRGKVAGTMEVTTANLQVAKTDNLTIPGVASIVSPQSITGAALRWIHDCGTGIETCKTYVLKTAN